MILETTNCPTCGESDSKSFQSTKTMMSELPQEWNFDQCQKCKMVYLNPRVNIEELASYYNEEYLPYRGSEAWGKFKSLVDSDQKKVDQRRVDTVGSYGPPRIKKILDVGCGKPTFLNAIRSFNPVRCTGLDFSDHGWKASGNKYEGIELIVGEISDLAEDSKYDVITMWQYLEHDYHPHQTLVNLLGHSHEHTRIIIEVPCVDSTTQEKYGEHWAGYHSPRHTGLYTPRTMELLLERSGWKAVDSYTYGTLDPYVLDWMSRMEKQDIDWNTSMEDRFISFVWGKIIRPKYFLHRRKSQGFMTVIATPK